MKPRQWQGARNIRGFIIERDPLDGRYHLYQRTTMRGRCLISGGRVLAFTPHKVGSYRTLYGATQAARRIKRGGTLPASGSQHRAQAWVRVAS